MKSAENVKLFHQHLIFETIADQADAIRKEYFYRGCTYTKDKKNVYVRPLLNMKSKAPFPYLFEMAMRYKNGRDLLLVLDLNWFVADIAHLWVKSIASNDNLMAMLYVVNSHTLGELCEVAENNNLSLLRTKPKTNESQHVKPGEQPGTP